MPTNKKIIVTTKRRVQREKQKVLLKSLNKSELKTNIYLMLANICHAENKKLLNRRQVFVCQASGAECRLCQYLGACTDTKKRQTNSACKRRAS